MKKKTVKTRVKSYKRRPSKEPKLDAIYYVLDHPNLNSTEQRTLLYLIKKARYCPQSKLTEANLDQFDGEGYYVRYTQETLAQEMKVSRATISRTIAKLNDYGLIHNHPGRLKQGEFGYQGVAFVTIPMMRRRWTEQDYSPVQKAD